MKFPLLSILVLTLVACSGSHQYKNAAEFEAAVQSWQLVGKSAADARIVLSHQGFTCKEALCYREESGFPCLQKQHVQLKVDGGLVTEAKVWKLSDGRLPTACL